jgi:hypothetical protein
MDINLSHGSYDDVNIMSIRSDGKVGIGKTNPAYTLDVEGDVNLTTNLNVGGTSGYVNILNIPTVSNSTDHTDTPLTITNQSNIGTATVLNDPVPVINLCRQSFGAALINGSKATFKICRWENNGRNSRSRMDINLSHGSYDDVNIMSIRSDGKVGIGKTNPAYTLDVGGDISGTNIRGNGANLTNLEMGNAATGTLAVNRGGTGVSSLASLALDAANITTGTLAVNRGGTGVSSLASLALDAANITTGTLAVNRGGTGVSSLASLALDAANITTGTLGVARGGTGVSTLASLSLSAANITTGTLGVARGGTGVSTLASLSLSAANITTGTLAVNRGGTGATTFTINKILFGNGTGAINQNNNLHWDNTNSRLGIGSISPTVALDVSGDINLTGELKKNGSLLNLGGDWSITNSQLYTDNNVKIKGKLSINNGNDSGILDKMSPGSLIVGDKLSNYGNTGELSISSTNIAGILLECLDKTEIVVNDNNDRVTSLISYVGGTLANGGNIIKIGNKIDTELRQSGQIISFPYGNVGIGTENPTAKLHVNGNMKVDGSITITDGQAINFGANGADGRMYRTGGNAYIEADDSLIIKSTSGGNGVTINNGGITAHGVIFSKNSYILAKGPQVSTYWSANNLIAVSINQFSYGTLGPITGILTVYDENGNFWCGTFKVWDYGSSGNVTKTIDSYNMSHHDTAWDPWGGNYVRFNYSQGKTCYYKVS